MCRRMMQSIAIKQSNESVVHSNRIYVMHIACVGSTDVVVPLLESMKHVMRTANEHRHLTLQLATLQRSISLVRIRACKVCAAWHATCWHCCVRQVVVCHIHRQRAKCVQPEHYILVYIDADTRRTRALARAWMRLPVINGRAHSTTVVKPRQRIVRRRIQHASCW